jgi:hypothetical protein
MNLGRERTPEEQAQAIMNSSDETFDDLMEGTEVNEGDDDFEEESESDLMSDMGIDSNDDFSDSDSDG